MGKRLRYLLAAAVTAAGLLAGSMSSAAAGEVSVEQVYVNLPEVTVYGTGIRAGDMDSYLGQRKLTQTGAFSFAETGEPIYYYLLLDVSNSMPESYFDKIKQSIQSFEQTLGEKDRMVLYTFGEQVVLQLDENHAPGDTQAVLSAIDNTDDKTLLFEAVSQAADKAEQVPGDVCRRKVIVVISDGEDFTVGKIGAQEAQENLGQKGIPAYAFGIADTARENTNNFGEFARTSGGKLTVFDEQQADQVLNNFHQEMESYDVLEFVSGDNIVSNSMEAFTMKTDANQTLTRNVMVSRHIPDQTAPVMIRAEKVASDQIEVEFSEPVSGADTASAYTVVREGNGKKNKETDETKETEEESKEEKDGKDQKTAAVAGITVKKDVPNTVLITFTSDLEPGEYRVSCTNITDLSMEKNTVANTAEFEVEQLPLGTRILNVIRGWYWVVLVLIVLVLAAVIWIVYRRVKKGRGVIYVDGKPVIASDVEIHKHVAIQEQEGMPFTAKVRVKGSNPEDLQLKITDSFIVGRSQICNLYFDDKRMSRQHFALEWDGQDMYVTDLDTTNGTLVNGVKISKRRRLQQNDKVSAGSVEMTIRW